MMLLSLRSRRKHKAWGASPRLMDPKKWARARDSGRKTSHFTLSPVSRAPDLPFCVLILGLAPQALCLRLLRRLSDFLGEASRPIAAMTRRYCVRPTGVDNAHPFRSAPADFLVRQCD